MRRMLESRSLIAPAAVAFVLIWYCPSWSQSTTTLVTLLPQAYGTLAFSPELNVLIGLGDFIQSAYSRSTDSNRAFRRGFAEFAIPNFAGVVVSASLILTETRATITASMPPDLHELAVYKDVDLTVVEWPFDDYDRETTMLATFETDANLPTQSFAFDVTTLVDLFKGSNLGFRVKLAVDPDFLEFGSLGTSFSQESDTPGVRIEVTVLCRRPCKPRRPPK